MNRRGNKIKFTYFVNVRYFEAQLCGKVNSVQGACVKCFAVHILKFEILQTTWKKKNKKHQNATFINEKLKTKSMMFFVSFFFMKGDIY